MIEIIMRLSGGTGSPEDDNHQPSDTTVSHELIFKRPDDPMVGPYISRQEETFFKLAQIIREEISK